MSRCWTEYDCRRRTSRSRRWGDLGQVRAVVREVLNPNNLNRVWGTMASQNGQSPGLDGVRLGDLSTGERFQLFRDLRGAVLDDTYRPQPLREVEIPKADGGIRTLKLSVVADRLLSKAVADALTPLAEEMFLDCSYGFRPTRDRFNLLADLKIFCETHHQWVLTADDVRKAFDQVPGHIAVDALHQLGHRGADPALVSLATKLITGHTPKEVGIPQGDALSPLTLNVLLHDALDTPMTAARGGHDPVGYYRYADNVLVVTRTATEGRAKLERMRTSLTEIGLSLKGAPGAPRDLSHGEHLDLLGLRLTRTGNTLTFTTPNAKWNDLQTKLVATHREANPTATARILVSGWVQAHAPAFRTDTRRDEETANRLTNLLRRTGHRHALTREQIVRTLRAAATRWERTVDDARNRTSAERPNGPHSTPGEMAHTTATPRDAEHRETDRAINDTTQDATDRTRTDGANWVESSDHTPPSYSSPTSSSMRLTRPSGRFTAFLDRGPVPLNAQPCRTQCQQHAVTPRSPTPRSRHRLGGRATAARPPPRPP